MDGAFLLYTAAQHHLHLQHVNPPHGEPTTSSSLAPSRICPSIIVLTPPLRDMVASPTLAGGAAVRATTQPQPPPLIDLDVLKHLYAAFPTAFFLLASEPVSPAPALTSAPNSDDAERSAEWQRQCDSVQRFFQQSNVYLRTCHLTLGVTAAATFVSPSSSSLPPGPGVSQFAMSPSQQQRRHVLHLNPSIATQVMRQQPWLKELHEYPRTLFTAPQVAAVLFLTQAHAPSSSWRQPVPHPFRMTTDTALEVTAQCEWVGESELAAELLECVALALCARERRMTFVASASNAEVERGTSPPIPQWVEARGDISGHSDRDGMRPAADVPAQTSTVGDDGSASDEFATDILLNVSETYSTHTRAGASTGPTTAFPISVISGCVGLQEGKHTLADCHQAPPAPRETSGSLATSLPSSMSTGMHLIVCSVLTSDTHAVVGSETESMRDLVSSLILNLHQKRRFQAVGGVRNEVIGEYKAHLCINGCDIISDDAVGVRGASQPPLPLASCGLEEALSRLASKLIGTDQANNHEQHHGSESSVACALDRACATLTQLHGAAHRQRLISLPGTERELRRRCRQTSKFNSDIAVPNENKSPLSLSEEPLASTSAVVLLCVDERSVAQWIQSGHPLLATVHGQQRQQQQLSCLHLFYDTPLYVCIFPCASVLPSRLQQRLCEVPWILDGLQVVQALCARTHGCMFVREKNGPDDTLGLTMSNRIHEWASAHYRNVRLCVFTQLSESLGRDGNRRPSTAAGGDTRGAETFLETAPMHNLTTPHCAMCTPAMALQRHTETGHLRMWHCTAAALSVQTPKSSFLLCDVPTDCLTDSQHVFAFARRTCSYYSSCYWNGCCRRRRRPPKWAVSRATPVQPRITPLKPGAFLYWFKRQLTLHHVLYALAVLLESQVERVRVLWFALMAAEGEKLVQSGLITVTKQEAVMDALQRITACTVREKQQDTALLHTLCRLPMLESLEIRLPSPTSLDTAWQAPFAEAAALPQTLSHVVREVDGLCRQQYIEQQQKQPTHQVGQLLTPSTTDTSAAIARLLDLVFVKARVRQLHTLVASGDGEQADAGSNHIRGPVSREKQTTHVQDSLPVAIPRKASSTAPVNATCSLINPVMEEMPRRFTAGVGNICVTHIQTNTAGTGGGEEVQTRVVMSTPPSPDTERFSDRVIAPPSPSRVGVQRGGKDASNPERALRAELDVHLSPKISEWKGNEVRQPLAARFLPPSPSRQEKETQLVFDVRLPSGGGADSVLAEADPAMAVVKGMRGDDDPHTTTNAAHAMMAPSPHTRGAGKHFDMPSNADDDDDDDTEGNLPAYLARPSATMPHETGNVSVFFRHGCSSVAWEKIDENTGQQTDSPDTVAVRARARLPTPPLEQTTAPSRSGGSTETTAPSARENVDPTPTVEALHSPSPPAALPPRPPCDFRWSSAASPGGLSATTPVSSIAALLATHLPVSQVPSTTKILEVAGYAAGQLTVEVQDPTCTASAALPASPSSGTSSDKHEGWPQPVAYLALLSVDVTSGALQLWEVVPCAIASLFASTSHLTEVGTGSAAASQPRNTRSRYTFVSPVPPSTVIASVYVGLRRAAIQWVTADDVLWMSGIAVALECPTLGQVDVSGVRADGFTLYWSNPSTRVKMVITALATPPARTLTHGDAELFPGDAGEKRRAELLRLTSPAIITGLLSGSIYHVELMPLHSARRIVRVGPPQHKQEVGLDTVVDAGVSVRTVIAATSVALSSDYMRVREVRLAHPAVTDSQLVKEKNGGASRDIASAPLCRHVAGRVVCPLISYTTSAFPASLFSHCVSFLNERTLSSGAAADVGHALDHFVRLHLSILPILAKDTGDSLDDGATRQMRPAGARDGYVDAHGDGTGSSGFHLTTVQDETALDADGKGHIHTRHFAFSMRAGEEARVVVSLRVQMRAERLTLQSLMAGAASPGDGIPLAGIMPSMDMVDAFSGTWVPLFHDVQWTALRARLGPFHVCGPITFGTQSTATKEAELVWEGTHTDYHVRLVKADEEAGGERCQHAPGNAGGGSTHSSHSAVQGIHSDVTGLYHVRAEPILVKSDGESLPPTLYRASLRLSWLEPSTQYKARVMCTENHVGAAQHCTWRTRPTPPAANRCHVIFDSSTRQLHLRFIRSRSVQQRSPRLVYEAVLRPLDTAVVVPAAASEEARYSTAASEVVQRVLDCSAVPLESPIALELRQRAFWEPTSPRSTTGLDRGRSIAMSAESNALVYCLVSNVQVRDITNTGGPERRKLERKDTAEQPVVEVNWVCGSEFYAPQVGVAFVVLNNSCRLPVSATAPGRLRLTVSQLRVAAAVEDVKEEMSTTDEQEETAEAYWWKGVLCITAFEGDAAPVPLQQPALIAPDGCLTLLLPPPPPLLPAFFEVENYEEDACVYVDARGLYDVYYNEYLRMHKPWLWGGSDEISGAHEAPRIASHILQRHVVSLLHQRIRLSLEVHGVVDLSAGDNAHIVAAERRLTLLDVSATSHQRIHIPLHAYRAYDTHLRLGLHVSCADDADVTDAAAPCIAAVSDPAASSPVAPHTVRLLVPRPSSLTPADVPVPPAEPIEDLTVSDITAREALVHWTPPLSLRRHLRRQPNLVVTYSVCLHPAQPVHEGPTLSPARHTCSGPSGAANVGTRSTVYATREPHLRLTSLAPATPYKVIVRGTGFGDYYATIRFLTAPVVMKTVVAQLRASVSIEAVVATAASRLPRRSLAEPRGQVSQPCGRPRNTPTLWAVLPASTVTTWSDAVSLKGAEGTVAVGCDSVQPHNAGAITVVTHYTAALVAPTGELLRQWVSSPGTTTTMYHEWDSVTAIADASTTTKSSYPHLEVMARAEVLAAEPSSRMHVPPVTEKADTLCGTREQRIPEALVMPGAIHSGIRHRTRIDIIGVPRFAHHEKPSPLPGSCTLCWNGSSRAGYDVSWCLSTDFQRVHHTRVRVPAEGEDWSSASAPSLTIPVEALSSVSRHSFAETGATVEPVCAFVCITGRRGSSISTKDTTSAERSHGYDNRRQVREGGSNTVCVAWMLPPCALGPLPSASIVYQTASKSTLLLPPQASLASAGFLGTGAAMEAGGAQEQPGIACTPHRNALTRSYTMVTCASLGKRYDEGAPSSGDVDLPRILPWTPAQYHAAGLSSGAGVVLVDVHTPNMSPRGTALELRCVDTVKDVKSVVWHHLTAHVVRQHTAHVSRLDPLESRNADQALGESDVPVQLRWLQSVVETRQQQHIPFVCHLSDLVLCGVQDAGSVLTPPLADSLMSDKGTGMRLVSKPAKTRHSLRRGSNAGADPVPSCSRFGGAPGAAQMVAWLPLQTAPLSETPNTRATATREDPRHLIPFVGECAQEPKGPDTATNATLEELAKLQAWTSRGCPTHRARFAWNSNDEVFVLRVTGPYEAVSETDDTTGRPDTTAANATDLGTPSVQEVKSAVRTALQADLFRPVAEEPHARTYTYTRRCAGSEMNGTAVSLGTEEDGALLLEADGTVSVARSSARGSASTKARPCTQCIAEVDGLLPEAVYRVQVTGVQSGDAVLRAQLLTPPSTLTQVVTIGETELKSAPKAQSGGGSGLTPKQSLHMHARHYNPHVYRRPHSGDDVLPSLDDPYLLAPGLHYNSQTSLEVHSLATNRCLATHVTHSSGDNCSHGEAAPSEKRHVAWVLRGNGCGGGCFSGGREGVADRRDSFSVVESVFSLDVEEAVRVVAVHQVDVSLSSEKGLPFLNSRSWGPLLWPPEVPAPGGGEPSLPPAPASGGFGWSGDSLVTVASAEVPPSPHPAVVRRLYVRRVLCDVPQLPRLTGLAVRGRTPQSLQLTWQWWPGSCCGTAKGTDVHGKVIRKDKEKAYQAPDKDASPDQPSTLFFVECCRLVHAPAGRAPPTDAAPGETAVNDSVIARCSDKTGDVCTAVTAVSANPVVTLAPLRPGSLYEVHICEIAAEDVANARALAVRRRTAAATKSHSGDPGICVREREVYAIQPAPLSGAAAAAVRALAQVSARPASLVLPLRRRCAKPSLSEGSNAVSGDVALPRGGVVCYVLTRPAAAAAAPFTPAAPRRTGPRVRRRPGRILVTLPSRADAPAHATHVHHGAGVRVLSYTAVMMVPENVMYVPKSISTEVCRWWTEAQPHGSTGREAWAWVWWARRTQSTMANAWLSTARAHRCRGGAGILCTTTDSDQRPSVRESTPADYHEHWNAELARRILGRANERSGAAETDALQIRIAPVEVEEVLDKKSSGTSSTASWEYSVPVAELVYSAATHEAAERGDRNENESQAAYILHVVEVLPLQLSQPHQPGGVSVGDKIVGGGQQITVSCAPLPVKRLQLIRDLRVQGTATCARTPSASPVCVVAAQCATPTAALRVEWKWSNWTHLCDAHLLKDMRELPSMLTPPPCAVRVLCKPLPPVAASAGTSSAAAAATTLDRARDPPLAAAIDDDCKDAIFVQHVERGERLVEITGLSPATLYQVVLSDVRIRLKVAAPSEGGCVRGDDKRLVALTPPAPLAQRELPALHYRLLRKNNTKPLMSPAHPPSPLGVEVRFQLPAAYRQSQGLLLSYYAVLVNLDAIDVDVCRTAEDFIAAAQEERLAPHIPRTFASGPRPSAPALSQETPVVYHNTSTQQRLSTTVTLRRPMEQRYSIVCFTAVCSHANKVDEVSVDGSADDGVGAQAEPHPTPTLILYSAPVMIPVRYPLSVRAAYDACGSTRPSRAS